MWLFWSLNFKSWAPRAALTDNVIWRPQWHLTDKWYKGTNQSVVQKTFRKRLNLHYHNTRKLCRKKKNYVYNNFLSNWNLCFKRTPYRMICDILVQEISNSKVETRLASVFAGFVSYTELIVAFFVPTFPTDSICLLIFYDQFSNHSKLNMKFGPIKPSKIRSGSRQISKSLNRFICTQSYI